MAVRVRLALIVVATMGVAAHANPLAIAGGSARSVGRAGTGTVADDGGGAFQLNPAALARRDSARLQIGIAFEDDAVRWRSDGSGAPVSHDQSKSSVLPQLSYVGSLGPWVAGFAVMTAGARDRAYRDPLDVASTAAYNGVFDYRYAGIRGALRRDTAMIGGARRVGDSLALGASVGYSRIALSETRRIWAGFKDAIGTREIGDPSRDLQLSFEGDAYVPSAVIGALVAPTDTPLELALSVGWVKYANVSSRIRATSMQGIGADRPPLFGGTAAQAELGVREPIAVRGGVRYVGDRVSAELDGDLWLYSDKAGSEAWHVRGARIVDGSMATAELDRVPTRLAWRTHGAVRGSADVELLAGFLYATAGYAYTMGASPRARMSPTFGDLGGHTVALGVEGTAGGFTYTIGWSRTFSTASQRESALTLDNPFGAGDAAVPRGTYDNSIDQVGVLLDIELCAP